MRGQTQHLTMPSKASVAIKEAKLRLALAEKWNRSAEVQLESAKANVAFLASQLDLITYTVLKSRQFLILESAKANVEIATSQVISSQNEVEEAKMHLKFVEEKYEVIDVDDSSLSSQKDEARDEAEATEDTSTDATMQIYIRFYGGRTVALNVLPSNTVENVKDMLYKRLNVWYSTRMRYAGKYLEKSYTLSIYNVSIFVSVLLCFIVYLYHILHGTSTF